MLASLLLTTHLLTPMPATAAASCPPAGMTRADLAKLKESKFEVPAESERNALAVGLLGCLGDPDPEVRDGVVFEGLSKWLRGKALTQATILALDHGIEAHDEAGKALAERADTAATEIMRG